MKQAKSKEVKAAKKAAVREVKKELRGGTPKPKHLKSQAVVPAARAAAQRTDPASRQYMVRFAHRDAHKLAWMAMICDPWKSTAVPIPVSITPGASPATPRMYEISLKGFMVTTTGGRGYIGANADAWMPDPTQAAGAPKRPYFNFLGNSSTYGARGYPVHYTNASYAGTGTGDYRSYPGPGSNLAAPPTGVVGIQLPNNFIGNQADCNPASGNNYQSYTNVATSLRVRPLAPASGSLVFSGDIVGVQQILGDTFATNPAAANSASTIGGIDCFAYVAGMTNLVAANVNVLSDKDVARTSWDMAEWPHEKDEAGNDVRSWMTLNALPNQSCSFGQWSGGNTGSALVGYPQVAFITAGGVSGQTVEFEAKYVYAYYGVASYEVRAEASTSRVPSKDVESVVTAGMPHMQGVGVGTKHAVAALAQEKVDTGFLSPKNVGSWLQSGSALIEEVTGQSLGELIGEGIGAVAALLL